MNHNYTELQFGINVLKTVFLPLVKGYLKREISPEAFEKTYIKAFHDYHGGGCNIPDDLAIAISTVFMDIDEFWPDFNADNPDHVKHLEENKNYTILEPELYQRCMASYDTMLAMLEKYAK